MYNLDLMALEQVIWIEHGSKQVDDYTFLYGITLGQAFAYIRESD